MEEAASEKQAMMVERQKSEVSARQTPGFGRSRVGFDNDPHAPAVDLLGLSRLTVSRPADALTKTATSALSLSTALEMIRKILVFDHPNQNHDDQRARQFESQDVHKLADSFLEELESAPRNALERVPKIFKTLTDEGKSSFTFHLLSTLCDVDANSFSRYVNLSLSLLVVSPSFVAISKAVSQERLDPLELTAAEHGFLSDSLLLRMLRTAVLPSAALERLLTRLRKLFLCTDCRPYLRLPVFIEFLSALAQQCFLTEYLYVVCEEERAEIKNLKQKLEHGIPDLEELTISLLLFALYHPLTTLNKSSELLGALGSSLGLPVSELIEATVGPDHAERIIRESITQVSKIKDDISVSVAQQYEENPYPRWVVMDLPSRNSATEILSQHFCDAELDRLSPNPRVLIAGCGTGRHSISAALRYGEKAHVVAIDLSSASLAHAIRKSREYGITNVEYLKLDLMNLPELRQCFDVIECVGVLHHLKEPMKGWRVLAAHLRPGGFMKVGIYSATARLPITYARKAFELRGSEVTPDMIRQCRQEVIACGDKYWSKFILAYDDFYSLSGSRDLLLHVQEHLFSIPTVEKSLKELKLEFRGFDLPSSTLKNYRKKYSQDRDLRNLENWNMYERENPLTFSSMYSFWCLKEAEGL